MKLSIFLPVLMALALAGEARAGARMNYVGPKSQYAKVGLRSFDIVLSIDGHEPQTASDVGTLIFERLKDGKKHEIRILRDGKEQVLRF